ncbi:glu leu phe val dehydrogenase family [Fusarium beomiforme]|uniref:Glu leu phe val dehydrogenase family n=1 Tax=Fusarium beomiforme TaxID=44412 RepID=A0A9P5A590_9HYPO|nr:glu leu phe val dehydrogenase family [Fusarium beomiforme]
MPRARSPLPVIHEMHLERSATIESAATISADDASVVMQDANYCMAQVPPYCIVDGCCTWYWTDKLHEAEGWIVIDSGSPRISGGGLFLHAEATLDEVRDVTQSMSAKLALSCQPQVCGTKGGIRFPHEHINAPLVLERFIRDNAGIISRYWGTYGGLHTDHAIINKNARAYCTPGTTTALDVLRVSLNRMAPTVALSNMDAVLGGTVDDIHWPLSEYSVGYVMATVLKELLLHTIPRLIGRVRLVVQGFGRVGSTFAHAVKSMGIGRVVAISSQYGFYVDNNGIDCDAIERLRRRLVERGQATGLDPKSLEAGLTPAQLESPLYAKRRAATFDEDHLADFLDASEGDVFVPCAHRYVLGPKTFPALVHGTFANVPPRARFILGGANNVFDQNEPKDKILADLGAAGILMLPEWVSNSGASNLFMRACSGLALEGYSASTLEACANDSSAFVNSLFTNVKSNAKTKSLWVECEKLAAFRRRFGAVNLLGVKKMSHLMLTTSNVSRAVETITNVYNAKANHDGSLYKLPGSGDPTLSIEEAPEDAGPADMGLSVQFSVYSLERARGVLSTERIPFEETLLQDGSNKLILDRELAGYPISLVQTPAREELDQDFSASDHVLGSIADSTGQIDHYAAIMPESTLSRIFHEYMLGFTPVRTFTVKAGATAEIDDGLMHVMGLPSDPSRVMVLTEGLTRESVFYKLMECHNGPYIHHMALQVENVDLVFEEVRERGWETTDEEPSFDLATGLRQFFLKEEEAGCILELIGRNLDDDEGYESGRCKFGIRNVVALARSLDNSYK